MTPDERLRCGYLCAGGGYLAVGVSQVEVSGTLRNRELILLG